jgi:MFS family permease
MSEPSPAAESAPEPSVYNATFWWAYVANLLLVCANAITFRFAEFVNFLGGTEESTGEIVRFGVVASILIRLTLARDLDRLGVRRMWISSSLLFIVGGGLLLAAWEVGWELYLARAAFAIGLACMFTCSNVHIQNQAPLHRRTEMIAALGSSGFLGMIAGAQFGDLVFEWLPRSRVLFSVLFGLTTLIGMIYLAMVLRIMRQDEHVHQPETPPPWTLLRRYWPGVVVLAALAMGVSFVVTTVFLTRHATSLGLVGIRTFFTGYALSAFLFRVATRTWSRRMGRHKLIVIGLLGHVVGHLLLIRVTTEWDYVLPALSCGYGHALLFPCVVSLGAERFPERYRGSGTTLILGFIDVGMALCAQPMGWLIDNYGFTPMYLATATFCGGTMLIYLAATWKAVDLDLVRAREILEGRTAVPEAAPAPLTVATDESFGPATTENVAPATVP